MKTQRNLTSIAIASLFICLSHHSAFALVDDGTRGGGDIQCDGLIKDLANNLRTWIQGGGPESGKLDLSSSLNDNTKKPYTYSEYDASMLALLAMPLDVSCVSQGDPGYPVAVDNSTKICASTVDTNGVHMVCDRKLFMAMSTDLQIEQDHHEFAIHVQGLEPDTGPISTYSISKQLSAFVADVTVKRLVVMSSGTTSADSDDSEDLHGLPTGSSLSVNLQSVLITPLMNTVSLGISSDPNVQAECFLGFTSHSVNRTLSGQLAVKNLTVVQQGDSSYTLNGTFILNGANIADQNPYLSCESTTRGPIDLTIGDLQSYLQSIDGTLNIPPAVPFGP